MREKGNTHTIDTIYYNYVSNVKTNFEENYGIWHFKNASLQNE